MNARKIARIIYEKINTGSDILIQGPLIAELGPDGYAEALRRAWVYPSSDGFVCVASNASIREDIKTLSEMYGLTPDTAASNTGTPAPKSAPAPAAGSNNRAKVGVGAKVKVGDSGQVYQGVISKVNSDGSYAVSFSTGESPRAPKPRYSHEEVQVIDEE